MRIILTDDIRRSRVWKVLVKGFAASRAGEPMGNVWMVCPALGIRTGAELGGFYLKNLPDGIYEIEFRRTGYVTAVVSVVLFYGVTSEIVVTMIAFLMICEKSFLS